MKKSILLLVSILGLSNNVFASGEDDPLLYKVMIDKFEIRNTPGKNPMLLDANAWIGKDLNKLWFKTETEYLDGKTEEAEIQLLYSRAISPYWDFQIGWRHDIRPVAGKDYMVAGFKGVTPYMFEVDASVFYGEAGLLGAQFDIEYEYMITQQLILSPELELKFYNQDNEPSGFGSGLSNMDLGLRLRYEVTREFAPYVGVNWSRKFGGAADFAREENEDTSDLQFVLGIRAWF